MKFEQKITCGIYIVNLYYLVRSKRSTTIWNLGVVLVFVFVSIFQHLTLYQYIYAIYSLWSWFEWEYPFSYSLFVWLFDNHARYEYSTEIVKFWIGVYDLLYDRLQLQDWTLYHYHDNLLWPLNFMVKYLNDAFGLE